jgi:hypothetical protein
MPVRVTTHQPEHLEEVEEPTKTEPNHEPWFFQTNVDLNTKLGQSLDPKGLAASTNALRRYFDRLRAPTVRISVKP